MDGLQNDGQIKLEQDKTFSVITKALSNSRETIRVIQDMLAGLLGKKSLQIELNNSKDPHPVLILKVTI